MKAFISTTSFLKPQNAAAKALAESFFDEVTYNELGVPLKGDEILSRLEGCDAYIAGVMMIVTIVLVIVNVFTRKLFNYIIIWSEEIATSCFVYSVFIGAAYAYRKHQHVGVDLLVERLPAGARRAVHLITSALLVVINGYITMLSVQFIQSSWIKRMPITKLPSSVVSTALVIGFGLMTIYSLVIFIKDLKSGNKLDGEVDA